MTSSIDDESITRAARNLRTFVHCDLGTDFRTYGDGVCRARGALVRAIADYVLLAGSSAWAPMLDACPGYGFETVVLASLLTTRIAASACSSTRSP